LEAGPKGKKSHKKNWIANNLFNGEKQPTNGQEKENPKKKVV